MIVLGIDPGTAKMGWGIIERKKAKGKRQKVGVKYVAHGLIKTSSSEPAGKRLALLKQEVGQLLRDHKVDKVVVEKIFFNINKRSALSVAQALGIVHLAASELDLPVYEYNALEVKLFIAGHGRADKRVVQNEMKKRLRLKKHPTPVHAADALAVAVCHILKNNET